MSAKKEFGDFQTPLPLARKIIALVDELIGLPTRVVEPTAGLGTFLDAAESKWGSDPVYRGYEINPAYVDDGNSRLSGRGICIEQRDFFQADWRGILSPRGREKILVVGNPPWVTNAALGSLGSKNLPTKSNFQGLRGFDAKTGKANFDIAEWMLIRIIEALPPSGAMAMLCKTMTARKVLRHFWKTDGGREDSAIFLIDAKTHFDVSVNACLFFVRGNYTSERTANIYATFDLQNKLSEFGLLDGNLVSNVKGYQELRELDGGSPYTWRSGLKHDAAEIMELIPANGNYLNGLDEEVEIESEYVYPLLKSSDIGNGRTTPRKAVLVTQKFTGDQTQAIRDAAPKTWAYLEAHSDKLDTRKSSIYKKRPRFSIFGIGEYSFAPWKVAISGLYKSFCFVVVPPEAGRPVMIDDTCYSIACRSEDEARLISDLLNSKPSQKFLQSIVFPDSKRPVTTDVLRRISLIAIARRLGRLEELAPYAKESEAFRETGEQQMRFAMERKNEYRTGLDEKTRG